MIELTAAYGALANKGVYREPTSIVKVLDKDGNVLLDNKSQLTLAAFKESTAFIITDWLQNVIQNGTGKRAAFKNMSIAVRQAPMLLQRCVLEDTLHIILQLLLSGMILTTSPQG